MHDPVHEMALPRREVAFALHDVHLAVLVQDGDPDRRGGRRVLVVVMHLNVRRVQRTEKFGFRGGWIPRLKPGAGLSPCSGSAVRGC